MARLFDDASSQYLISLATPITAHPVTLACWFKVDDLTINQTLLGVLNPSAAIDLQGWHLQAAGAVGGDPVRAGCAASATVNYAVTSTGYSANVWQHACGVFSSITSRDAFLNGGSKGSAALSRTPSAATARAMIGGAVQATSGRFTSGSIAEAGIWNVALTDAEVAILALGVSPLLVRPDALVAYWPLIGRNSPENDRVGDFPLTVTGATVADHCRIIHARGGVRMGVPTPGAAAYSLTGAAGSFILAGQVANLLAARKIAGAVGAFAETGQAAGLLYGRRIGGDAAAFALDGQSAGLLAARRVGSDLGAFLFDGQAAGLLAGRRVSGGAGAFALNGQNATLIYTPVGAYVLVAGVGVFSLSGQTASLLAARRLAMGEAAFVFTGQDAVLDLGDPPHRASGSGFMLKPGVSGRASKPDVSGRASKPDGSGTIY